MRQINAAILLSLFLTGAGCLRSTAQITDAPIPQPPKLASTNLSGELKMDTANFSKYSELNEFASCRVDISYPTFGPDELSEKQLLQINHELAHFIAEALGSSAEIDSPAELETLAEVYQTACEHEITREYTELSSAGEDLFTNLNRYLDSAYTVTLNQDGWLSFNLNYSSYAGGAHPNYLSTSITADRDGEQLITLEQLIQADKFSAFLDLVQAKLLAEHSDSLYPEALEAPVTPENFYLTPTTLVIYFNPYDIAPYAAGPIEIEFTLTEISEYLDLNGPLQRLIP